MGYNLCALFISIDFNVLLKYAYVKLLIISKKFYFKNLPHAYVRLLAYVKLWILDKTKLLKILVIINFIVNTFLIHKLLRHGKYDFDIFHKFTLDNECIRQITCTGQIMDISETSSLKI